MENIMQAFTQNPGLFGIFLAVVGFVIMLGAILKWGWIVGNEPGGSKVRTGLIGLIIYKLFGRRGFFIFTGASIMILGVIWFVLMTFL